MSASNLRQLSSPTHPSPYGELLARRSENTQDGSGATLDTMRGGRLIVRDQQRREAPQTVGQDKVATQVQPPS